MIISLEAEKTCEKTSVFHDKNLTDIRDTMEMPKLNKGNLQQADSLLQIKQRETQSNFTKIIKKARLSNLYISVQYST